MPSEQPDEPTQSWEALNIPPEGPSPTQPLPPLHGSIQRQEAGFTVEKPPTLAQMRAREKARERAEAEQQAAEAALVASRQRRRRKLIGGVAIVGVAALVGGGYLLSQQSQPRNVTAYCITDDNGQQTVVSDDQCVQAQDFSASYPDAGPPDAGPHLGGILPIFLYNGHQYRYYYGGNNTIGSPPVGGGLTAPPHSTVSTKSGTVIRGGLGVSRGSGGS